MNEQQAKWDGSFKLGRDYNPLNQILLDLVLKKISNDKKVAIDLGCGTGEAVVKLAQRGMNVTGVDWSSDALEKGKLRAKEASVSELTSFIEADLNNLNTANLNQGKADLVLCKLVIAFIDDKKVFLQDIKKLLSTDGVLIILTPILHELVTYLPEDKPGIAVKYEEFKLLLSEVFESVDEFDHSYYGDKGDLVTFIVK